MTDRLPDEADDHAWLLARERGAPGPAISEARACRYAQLATLIADLPAVPAATVQRGGWERAVLAAIDAEIDQPAVPSKPPPPAVTGGPRAKQSTATTRYRRRPATFMVGALAMVASVAILLFVYRDRDAAIALEVDPQRPERAGSPNPRADVTRGMHVEHGRLGFDHALQVRRSDTAAPRELHDGDTVMTGDIIRVSVRSSSDAHLYLAFCKDGRLQTYPWQHGLRISAGKLLLVPEFGSGFVVDAHLGTEVLYLILSRDELALADPQLGQLVAASSDETTTVDCGASLEVRLMKSTATSPPGNVLRGETIPKKPMPRSRAGSPADPDLVNHPENIVWYAADGAATPESVVAVDADGIAVVRYRFIHVAPEQR